MFLQNCNFFFIRNTYCIVLKRLNIELNIALYLKDDIPYIYLSAILSFQSQSFKQIFLRAGGRS